MIAPPRVGHLASLLDDTGVAQHATYAVAAREHGYCLDDNARGLLYAVSLQRMGLHPDLAGPLFARTASFVQHAWNEPAGRFRNFMAYDRTWLEDAGSQDSHGRAVWVLGRVVLDAPDPDARLWAVELLERSVPALLGFASPRAVAFGLLGLVGWTAGEKGRDVGALRARLADRLCEHLRDSRRPDWVWFEDVLSYDNPRLCHALISAGDQAGRADWVAAGLDTLRWLDGTETVSGQFSPVGSDGFWQRGGRRARFDQQPIEAAATVAASLCAARVTGERTWFDAARRAHGWFLGENDLGLRLVVEHSGGCRDGLHPDRANANQGAESTLAWLQADLEFREAWQAVPQPGAAATGLTGRGGRSSSSVTTTRAGSMTQ